MRVLEADEMGFCFGVRDALQAARAVAEPATVTIHGELVHNEAVLAELDRRGFRRSPEDARDVPATPRVLVTAHGISERERGRLLAAGKELIDTTCPLVRRAHDAAQAFARAGRFVVVLGRPGHVEVRGVVEDLGEHAVVATAADVRDWGRPGIGIVCQTTVPIRDARALAQRIRAANPGADVVFADTVCEPTKRRIAAVERLAGRVDALVVVGGKRSNNTLQLVRLAERLGTPAQHVQGPDDLDREALRRCAVVGLTAGTSTLDATIAAVRETLLALPAARAGA